MVWEQEKCLGQRTGAGAVWMKTVSPKHGQKWWLGTGKVATGCSSPGGMCCRRNGGRAGDVLCGHSEENTIPDGQDEMGMLEMPQTKTAREGKKGSRTKANKISDGAFFFIPRVKANPVCISTCVPMQVHTHTPPPMHPVS